MTYIQSSLITYMYILLTHKVCWVNKYFYSMCAQLFSCMISRNRSFHNINDIKFLLCNNTEILRECISKVVDIRLTFLAYDKCKIERSWHLQRRCIHNIRCTRLITIEKRRLISMIPDSKESDNHSRCIPKLVLIDIWLTFLASTRWV